MFVFFPSSSSFSFFVSFFFASFLKIFVCSPFSLSFFFFFTVLLWEARCSGFLVFHKVWRCFTFQCVDCLLVLILLSFFSSFPLPFRFRSTKFPFCASSFFFFLFICPPLDPHSLLPLPRFLLSSHFPHFCTSFKSLLHSIFLASFLPLPPPLYSLSLPSSLLTFLSLSSFTLPFLPSL